MSHSVRGLRWFCVVLYIVMIACSLAFHRFEISFSVALGGAVAILNFAYLERFLPTVLGKSASAQAAGFATMVSFYFRFMVLAAAIYYFTVAGWVHFAALCAGLSVTAVSVFLWFFAAGRLFGEEDYERAY